MKTIFSSQPFQDEGGNALAAGSLILTLPAGIYEIINGGGQVAASSLIVNFDATGKLPNTSAWCTDELTGSPVFAVQVCKQANGLQVMASATWNLSGTSPIDVSFELPASIPGVSQPVPAGQQVVTFASTMVFNASSFSGFTTTLTGTASSTSVSGGQAGLIYTWKIIQDASGGHPFPWPTNVINPPAIGTGQSSQPNAITIASFYYDGANFYPSGAPTVN